MQNQHLKLKEIIWEITGECKNGCTYCGSKSIRNIKNSNEKILKIAEAISLFPPEEINISGGDSFLVEPDIHEKIIQLFQSKNIVCKLIVNPNSLCDGIKINQAAFDVIRLYDWIGISINSKKELDRFISYKKDFGFKNFTVITNFNVQNLYDFDLIEKYVKEQDVSWTIQFTVYDDPNNPLALYNPENEGAFNFLENKYIASTAKIILSDNIRADIGCGAGLCSVGITYDGTVIPCLSMRSWTKPLLEKDLYNITETPLQEIWINGFKQQRFGCFKCCKDACNNKFLKIKNPIFQKIFEIDQGKEPKEIKNWKKILEEITKKQEPAPSAPFPRIEPRVVMYGVSPGQVYVYGVPDGRNVYFYGASSFESSDTSYQAGDDSPTTSEPDTKDEK